MYLGFVSRPNRMVINHLVFIQKVNGSVVVKTINGTICHIQIDWHLVGYLEDIKNYQN